MSYETTGFTPGTPESIDALDKIDQLLNQGYKVAFTATITQNSHPYIIVYLHKSISQKISTSEVSLPGDDSSLGFIFDAMDKISR